MNKKIHSLALLVNLGIYGVAQAQEPTNTPVSHDNTIVITTTKQNLQAPGISTITTDEIHKNPVAHDVSEIIHTMPGINLTSNSTSGQHGNNQQIDIHSMGPENTLILIDSKPVSSHNSVHQGWHGKHNTHGDTSWVPPEMIEHIEVLHGPAAARYGNSTAGSMVNIITKKGSSKWHSSWDTYFNAPEHKEEGATKHTNFSLTSPLGNKFSFHLYGNLNKTQADTWDINQGHQSTHARTYATTLPARHKGVINKDINGMVHWDFTPLQSLELEAGYSHQGNLYTGNTQNTNSNSYTHSKYGNETNHLYHQNYTLTWNSGWDNSMTTSNWVQYKHTHNSHIPEGLAGSTKGKFNKKATQDFININLDDMMLHSKVNLPIDFLINQTLTLGTEWNQQQMKDLSSNTQALTRTNTSGTIDGMSTTNHSPYSKAEIFSLFAKNNMELTDSTIITPGLHFNHHSIVSNNWSPALNISQGLGNDFTLKMGITHAYKAPSLYQTNPNYILYSKGQGCYASTGSCYLQGNNDLKAETSINKEIGLEFKHNRWLAGITWFHNNYHNKIEAGYVAVGQNTVSTNLYQWDNMPKAVVEGLEGSLNIPVSKTVMWTNNITYMLKSENKTTGNHLSIIPEYTLNSTLSWQAQEDLSMQTTFTWYSKQQPKKYNYKGQPAVGPETKEISPYSIVGLSTTWDVTKNVSLTSSMDNLFNKHLWHAGNAQTTGNLAGANYITSARAYTYNKPGHTWYMSINTHF